jgi:hypothetical protein
MLLLALHALPLALAPAQAGCDCRTEESSPTQVADSSKPADLANRPSLLQLAPREPGPPRSESAEQLTQAQQQAQRWTGDLLKGGLARREVASMADIRGYRFFRRRSFGRALRWFTIAVATDPTYEPALFNAARAAALLGETATAREHLSRLRGLGTPLSRRQLDAAARHKDFARLRKNPPIAAPETP